MLDHITPVLLTYNEERNITRTLTRLRWARDVVVVDSGSTDKTLALLAQYSNVRVFSRCFDTHANQWRYAVEKTSISTEWVFRLDADYQVSDALVSELTQLDPGSPTAAYRIGFDYAVFGRPLRSSLYPSNTVLLRRGRFTISDKGHTEVWAISGPIVMLNAKIVHDDWKSIEQWLPSQSRYMQRELRHPGGRSSGLVSWLRRTPPLMPIVMFVYCLFGKGLIFNGRAGLFYSLQRLVSESILSLLILEEKLRTTAHRPGSDDR